MDIIIVILALSGWASFFYAIWKYRENRPNLKTKINLIRFDKEKTRIVFKSKVINIGKKDAICCEGHFDVFRNSNFNSIIAGTCCWRSKKEEDYNFERENIKYTDLKPGDWEENWFDLDITNQKIDNINGKEIYLFPYDEGKGIFFVASIITYGNYKSFDFLELLIKDDIRANDDFEEVMQKIEFRFEIPKKRKFERKLKKIINKIEYHEHTSPT